MEVRLLCAMPKQRTPLAIASRIQQIDVPYRIPDQPNGAKQRRRKAATVPGFTVIGVPVCRLQRHRWAMWKLGCSCCNCIRCCLCVKSA